ncbi:MAG TPA: serine hydrolase [Gaiellales bacterium]|nr:serine hydrolase [Gaiellales bacterium]
MIDDEGSALGVTTANWLDGPYNRWGFRHVPDLCRTAPIGRGDGPVRKLPRAERDLDGFAFAYGDRRLTLAEMLAETFTDGFLVIQDGAVVTERYLDGMRESDTHLLMSCSKSLTSILCGVLAARGLLAPGDLVTGHLHELAGTTWDGCRLQDILDMRAGNAWNYDIDEYTILAVSDYHTHELQGAIAPDTETWIRTIGRGPYDHGSGPFRYCSLATDVLGWVLERVGGAAFPELFSRELWSRIGAESDAQIMLDNSGFPIVEGGICTTLCDLGRFGLMCLEDGLVDGGQVVPAEWIARVRRADPELTDAFRASGDASLREPGAFYHDQWWVHDGPRGVYAAMGMNGQSILVHRPARIVIAKFSTFPDALDDSLFDLHHAGMIALCEHLA